MCAKSVAVDWNVGYEILRPEQETVVWEFLQLRLPATENRCVMLVCHM